MSQRATMRLRQLLAVPNMITISPPPTEHMARRQSPHWTAVTGKSFTEGSKFWAGIWVWEDDHVRPGTVSWSNQRETTSSFGCK